LTYFIVMHEVSIAQEMCSIIEQALGHKQPLQRVVVTIGPLSGIMPEALEFCFSAVAEQTGFGAPVICINRTLARIRCLACNTVYETNDFYTLCPGCGSFDRELLSGSEFTIDSVDVKEERHV